MRSTGQQYRLLSWRERGGGGAAAGKVEALLDCRILWQTGRIPVCPWLPLGRGLQLQPVIACHEETTPPPLLSTWTMHLISSFPWISLDRQQA
jgi:hypothetical protein